MSKRKTDPLAAFTEPMTVSVVDGEVVISGPAWVHAAFVPAAAQTSATRLAAASRRAKAGNLSVVTEKPRKPAKKQIVE